MKTLGAAVGLVLLLAVVCSAMPHGPNDLKPGRCCFKFFKGKIPNGHIWSIAKTHQSCSMQGFVINTPKGDFCVTTNQKWAINAFLKVSKGSNVHDEQGAPALSPA